MHVLKKFQAIYESFKFTTVLAVLILYLVLISINTAYTVPPYLFTAYFIIIIIIIIIMLPSTFMSSKRSLIFRIYNQNSHLSHACQLPRPSHSP